MDRLFAVGETNKLSCRAHQSLPVRFLLLQYSVLFTVESLSLLYILAIAWSICFRRWCIDKLGVFQEKQISMCLDPHLISRVRLAPLNRLSPPVKYFTDRSKAVLLLWIFYVFVLSCACYVFVRVCLFVLCGHLLGKGWPLGSRLCCLTVSLSLSHWYYGSGMVLDYIDSWSLHTYLLWWPSLIFCQSIASFSLFNFYKRLKG